MAREDVSETIKALSEAWVMMQSLPDGSPAYGMNDLFKDSIKKLVDTLAFSVAVQKPDQAAAVVIELRELITTLEGKVQKQEWDMETMDKKIKELTSPDGVTELSP